MGSVYEASHTRLERPFAIKFLGAHLIGAEEPVARLRREAELTSRLQHPNIVAVVDFNQTDDDEPYIVMELLQGESLGQRLRHDGRFTDLEEVSSIMRELLSALAAAHDQGIVHRDLKPTNVFLCRSAGRFPHVKVLDFGVSKVHGAVSELTTQRAVLGSPRYISPEQARGRSAQADHRADIFAIGVILFEMLTGTVPFAGPTPDQALYQVVHEPPQLPPRWADVPARLQQVILNLMDKDPAQRPQSCAAAWDALAAALKASGIRSADVAGPLVADMGATLPPPPSSDDPAPGAPPPRDDRRGATPPLGAGAGRCRGRGGWGAGGAPPDGLRRPAGIRCARRARARHAKHPRPFRRPSRRDSHHARSDGEAVPELHAR